MPHTAEHAPFALCTGYPRAMRNVALAVAMLGIADCNSPAPAPSPTPAPPPAPVAARCTPHVASCRGDDLVDCTDAGVPGAVRETCKDGCKAGACVDACATRGNELVYVLTDDHRLLSFDPQKLPEDPFRVIGTLACGVDSPNSMAVDHAGIAWVVDHDRHLYRTSILDAHCTAVAAPTGADVPPTFGMGFASPGKRTPGSNAEILYVASATGDGSLLGQLDTTVEPAAYRAIAPLAAQGRFQPELSGNGDGELFGYFPGEPTGGGFVQQIDRQTGAAVGTRWPMPVEATITAWAFAQWGGVFYVFATAGHDSQVHAIRRKTGAYSLVRDHLPYQIVGAGVSTCAPELEKN